MTKYILLDVPNRDSPFVVMQEERIIFDDKIGNKIRYVCEICFKEFNRNNPTHLEKCRIEYPVDCCWCFNQKSPSANIYELSSERGYNRKIMKIIRNMANFSKMEQDIDLPITTTGLLGKNYSSEFSYSQFQCYVFFHFKQIASYCLIQRFVNVFNKVNVVLRDVYTVPCFRGNGHASKIIQQIARRNGKNINELILTSRVSEDLKKVLKKLNINKIRIIDGEDFSTLKYLYL